jgi:hypothetical protein
MAYSGEVAMLPTIAEQLAAARRRELEEAAMGPYEAYRLYQIERPKSAAEIRLADERAGRLAAAAADVFRQLTRPARRWQPARRRGIAPQPHSSCGSDRMTERIGVR